MKLVLKTLLIIHLITTNFACAQAEVKITIAYPDHESYFIYSIPPSDEHARFGGMYYVKIENSGTTDLTDWEMHTFWKALNSTWGVVEKTTINPATGEIKLTGPTWSPHLTVGESITISGEWIPTGSIEDWIEFLPRETSFTSGGDIIPITYETTGTVDGSGFTGQIVKPLDSDLKTYSELKTIAYFPLFDAERAWCSLQRYGKNIDQLRVQLYSITPDGKLRAGQDLPDDVDPIDDIHYWYDFIDEMGVVEYCLENEIELIPVAFNYNPELGDFDQIAVHNMMVNPTLRANHINDIVAVMLDKSAYAGIDIDYESLMATDRDNYSAFMEDLAEAVHAEDKILTTAVHTKVGPGTWYGPQAQDFERLGNAVDEILLMTYDLHWATSPTFADPPPTAGCQATPDWMNDVAFFGISEIEDPSKIQLGLPYYGYRWKHLFENHTLEDPGVGLTYEDAQNLIEEHGITPAMINREANGNEPYFVVEIEGVDWVCYYQDDEALNYKLNALYENDLKDYIGGIGIWRLGGENDAMWNTITNHTKGSPAIIDNTIDCSAVSSSEKIESKATFITYPNPARDIIHIKDFSPNDIVDITILDMQGRIIYYTNTSSSTISIKNLASGTYVLKLKTTHGNFHFTTFMKS